MKNNKENKSRKALIRLEIAGFVIWQSIVSFGKNFVTTFAPAVDRRAGGSFSFVARTVFGVMTLEGPRLMLLSRYRAARMKTGTKVGISAISGTAVAAIILATVLISSQLMAVTVNGKVIGYVENEEQLTALRQLAKEKLSERVGTEDSEILIEEGSVSLETVLAPQQQAMTPVATTALTPAQDVDAPISANGSGGSSGDPAGAPPEEPAAEEADASLEDSLVESLIDSLLDESAIKTTFYTININDEDIAALGTMKEASDVLKAIADMYTPTDEGDIVGRFADDVQIIGVTTTLDHDVVAQKAEDVIDFLITGKPELKTYTATEEDILEDILNALGISENELFTEYPDYDFEEINPGDIFATTIFIPYIRYSTEGFEISYEEVPFDTVEENSNDLFLGQRETVEEGEPGECKVTRFVTRVNGEVISRQDTDYEVIVEPKPEVVNVGVRLVFNSDAYVGPSDGWGGGGNGVLGRPLNSWYLSRSVQPGHNGADMCTDRGAPIFAAAFGRVSFSGVYGGYGNLVILDHDNGLQTYYAHCDTLNVSVGQMVNRGQQIATVGSTGRSTAFHLHFEVRVHGVVQEPMSWIG